MLIPDELSSPFDNNSLIKLASGLAFFSQINEIQAKGYKDVEEIFGKVSGQCGNFRKFVTDSVEASYTLQEFAEEVL
ncbi:16435_t:CDS:1, partial [Acaulospora morrowiae]